MPPVCQMSLPVHRQLAHQPASLLAAAGRAQTASQQLPSTLACMGNDVFTPSAPFTKWCV